MTQPKFPSFEREGIVLQTVKRHREISQNDLLEELAAAMAGNTARKILRVLRTQKQLDYYKKKNRYIWYTVEQTTRDGTDTGVSDQELTHAALKLRKLRSMYKSLDLASKLHVCRSLTRSFLVLGNTALLASLTEDTERLKELRGTCLKYLKELKGIILSTPEDAEMVWRGVFSDVAGISKDDLEEVWPVLGMGPKS